VLQHSGGCGKRCGLAASELVTNNKECWQICPQAEGCSKLFGMPPMLLLLVSYNASSKANSQVLSPYRPLLLLCGGITERSS